jgi:hypothetical protein
VERVLSDMWQGTEDAATSILESSKGRDAGM